MGTKLKISHINTFNAIRLPVDCANKPSGGTHIVEHVIFHSHFEPSDSACIYKYIHKYGSMFGPKIEGP